MKFEKINKHNRDIIQRFFESINKEYLLKTADFKLMDHAPNNSYYSYYVSDDDIGGLLRIDYDNHIIGLYTGGNTDVCCMKF